MGFSLCVGGRGLYWKQRLLIYLSGFFNAEIQSVFLDLRQEERRCCLIREDPIYCCEIWSMLKYCLYKYKTDCKKTDTLIMQ